MTAFLLERTKVLIRMGQIGDIWTPWVWQPVTKALLLVWLSSPILFTAMMSAKLWGFTSVEFSTTINSSR